MYKKSLVVIMIVTMLAGFVFTNPVSAIREVDGGFGVDGVVDEVVEAGIPPHNTVKPIDYPSIKDYQRNLARIAAERDGNAAEASSLALTGTDRVLVLLVEFAGEDTFTYTPGVSEWDPLGIADPAEYTGTVGDCSLIDDKLTALGHDITQPIQFTYGGPAHNEIPRPISADDRSGDTIWTEDFSPQWFTDFMFGNGVEISYTRQDSSVVYENFLGQSVKDFYDDLSSGDYEINGDVIGWLPLDHSTWYYDADQCPGARSGTSVQRGGLIPGAGTARTLVMDAVDKVNELYPDFDWTVYDQDGDGEIDRLWIVHSGYGEEDATSLLNATDYGEAAVWSHSSAVYPVYEVDPVNHISAGAYIVMPENGGIGVFAHEYSHNLGSIDLYTYGNGETSAGFWTTMADDWTGYPIGFEPPSMDPMHLDWWGWLDPVVVDDPSMVYDVTIGQASYYPDKLGLTDMARGVRIDLPDGEAPLALPPWSGSYYWWGGKGDVMNSMMTLNAPVSVPATGTTTFSFDLVYDIEEEWDFMWVQASTDGGTTWDTLENANTNCVHVPDWIGGLYGFTDECGFSGWNANWPDPEVEDFDLTSYAGQNVVLRLWYMTDWGTTYSGPFVDNVSVVNSTSGTLFSDGAETGGTAWTYEPKWVLSNGNMTFAQSFYLQWRNIGENGGYDSALGDPRFRYGPTNTGLLVWYNNTMYTDNEIENYLTDFPSFGPKGAMLVVDSHADPIRYPSIVADYPNEGSNLVDRSLMRDAPFTLDTTNSFMFPDPWIAQTVEFPGLENVKTFHDALGYYPGSSYGPRSPYQSAAFVTNQWDASVVIPAKSDYALKAPGYLGTDPFRFECSINSAGLLGCYWYPGGIGVDGGNGNPADVNAQYGWHVELLDQAADNTWGEVRIWNSQYAVDSKIEAGQTNADIGDVVSYTATFKNSGSMMDYFACVEFDNSKVEYVADSAEGAPLLASSCPFGGITSVQLETKMADVGALIWLFEDAEPGLQESYNFVVMAKATGLVDTNVNIHKYDGSLYTSLTEKNLFVNYIYYMPVVAR